MRISLEKNEIEMAAEMLDLLVKNKCTIADAYRITGNVADYYKMSATVQQRDFAAELNKIFGD